MIVLTSACAEPAELAAWTLPIPDGTRIIEYPAVTEEGRTERIELVEDLVLGADDSDPNQSFYQPTDVAVDDDGRMFVVDAGNHRVQVFDAVGSFVTTLGREGQGPGEFKRPVTATVIGDRLAVSDTENVRLSIWSTDGEHIDDVPLDVSKRAVSFLAGTDAGHAVVQYSPFTGPGTQNLAAATLQLDGTETLQYIDLPLDRTPTLQRGARRSFGYGNPRAYPSYAADAAGNVYITPGDEYQVLALAPDGSARWAMCVAWQRPAMPQSVKDAVVERLRRGVPDVTESEVNFLDRLPSVSRMVVDGAGRLFVYPYVLDDGREGVYDVPVDVYAPDGERLFSGMIANHGWRRSEGEFVYGAGSDRETGEYRVFRWRLTVPAE